MIQGRDLFARVVSTCGLSAVFGSGTVERALRRVHFEPDTLTPAQLLEASDSLRAALSLFLSRPELEIRLQAIARLAIEAESQ
jgi:hypothetical protein